MFDVGIGIPLLASVERLSPRSSSSNDKIAKPFLLRQYTSSRNDDKKQKVLLDFRVSTLCPERSLAYHRMHRACVGPADLVKLRA
ncbi:hypothetical protein [Devosia aurantiaca]|uniref:Uncharacterized protein n=1 Tax=Devosia aurantiaca TaxID=2714858 RepID=A0A6M1SAV7_9HYPH|nr:hypothetical protein [Devosia aurantiaca]NGP17069.1 hypothetical protein [Devosia aurantiaca]